MPKETKLKPAAQTFLVQLEAVVPIILTYRIVAETPEEAIRLALTNIKKPYQRPMIIYSKLRKIKAQVYRFGTKIIELVKSF